MEMAYDNTQDVFSDKSNEVDTDGDGLGETLK